MANLMIAAKKIMKETDTYRFEANGFTINVFKKKHEIGDSGQKMKAASYHFLGAIKKMQKVSLDEALSELENC